MCPFSLEIWGASGDRVKRSPAAVVTNAQSAVAKIKQKADLSVTRKGHHFVPGSYVGNLTNLLFDLLRTQRGTRLRCFYWSAASSASRLTTLSAIFVSF